MNCLSQLRIAGPSFEWRQPMSFLTKLPRKHYEANAFERFDGNLERFDLGIARAMAWACQLAYETDDAAKVASIAEAWEIAIPPGGIISEEILTPLPKASTQAILGDRADAIIIAFAGTDPLVVADWISDFDIAITASGTANGFVVAAQAAAAKIDAVLSTLPADKPIFVTGHSLGGALAVLEAQRFDAAHSARVRAVYTFGMPRTGSAAFAARYDQVLGARTYRLVHGHDLVPTVAPSRFGFRHVGRHLHCARQGKFDAKSLAAVAGSDEPQFVQGVANELNDLLHGSLSGVMSMAERLKVIAALTLGVRPGGMRSDPGALMIELLPPTLRDHMPDRYIAAAS